ncbi:hypothetical protein GCM10022254_56540 [Actinomadura meridiana]|uniref:Uncharacterized protein n=1 Tax=Actinomadura meridiana TaxID=559626 RepID=A0ABP8CGM1_9ACTN
MFTTDRTNTVSRTDPSPIHAANACSPVAIGPYTEGVVRHSSGAPATGSPGRSTARVAYGSWPVAAIRPYEA